MQKGIIDLKCDDKKQKMFFKLNKKRKMFFKLNKKLFFIQEENNWK